MDYEAVFLIAYVILIVGIVVLRNARDSYDNRSEDKLVDEFSASLINGIRSGSLKPHKGVEKLYDGVCANRRASDRYCDLYKHLGQIHAKVIRADKKTVGENATSEDVRLLAEFIASTMDSLDYEAQFSELPEVERGLLADATAFVDKNDKDSVKRKLSELATAIKTRNEELRRSEKGRMIGYALAVVSITATVIFGLLAI